MNNVVRLRPTCPDRDQYLQDRQDKLEAARVGLWVALGVSACCWVLIGWAIVVLVS